MRFNPQIWSPTLPYCMLLCKTNIIDKSLALINAMKDQGVLLDVYAYNVLMDGMTKSGRFVDAIEIFHMLQTKGYPLTVPSYDTMIHALCKEDFLDESLGLFSEMEVRDCLPDAITFDIIIRTLLDKGEKVKAAEFIHIMNERFGILNR